ncbi:MAG: polymerase sigma-70 factor, subfamily [Acidimicrobiaceae bacterium]|jgi:RNA polymerase sigma-70 factor (ECF subfamily)
MVWFVTPEAGFEAVLSLAQAGDERAIGQLYRTYNPPLLRFLAGQAPAAKEDLAQDVWMSVASSLASFDGDEGQFRAWLFTIARRRTIDHWRVVGRRPREVIGELLDLPQPEPPDQLAIQSAIAELTAGLTDEQTEVVLLRVVAGLTVEQVASIIGKSPGAIRVMQHRALRRLATQISRVVTP